MSEAHQVSRQPISMLIAGGFMFTAGWLAQTQTSQVRHTSSKHTALKSGSSQSKSAGKIVSSLTQWSGTIDETDNTELHTVASRLLESTHRQDTGHWAPLLAKWSEADGAGMIAFLEKQAPPEIREKLLQLAWFAWGYAEPDAAFAAATGLSETLTRELLTGITEASPRKAAAYVRMVPDSQFAITPQAAAIFAKDPKLTDSLLSTALYGGGRLYLEKARIDQLAKTDPAAAVAYAKSLGIIGNDPAPPAIKKIAQIDPTAAAAQVLEMPSSRSKALSAVALTSTWAARDLDAAAAWARNNFTGPVLHHSLVAAAVSAGDPAAGLDLINEAGWEPQGNFFVVRDWGSLGASESLYQTSTQVAARQLIERVAQSAPQRAQTLLKTKIPAGFRSTIIINTAIEP